jgi:nitrogen PTS system EIIA component
MELSVPQVARMFNVTENTVTRWIQQDNLPAHEVNSQYRLSRTELLEWAAVRKMKFSPTIFEEVSGDRVGQINLADAIERGGVAQRVQGGDRCEVFREAVAHMPVSDSFDRENLLELMMAREKTGGTAVGDGIAIPHPRYPIVLPCGTSVVRVCYLDHPLDFHAPDGILIHTLFVMVSPTVHEHLQLLARLASVLRRDNFRKLLSERPDKTRLISAVRAEEYSFAEQAGKQKA